MSEPDAKKRILHQIDRYSAARVSEQLAGDRDAHAAVKRNYDEGRKILANIGMDLDALLTELVGLRGRCLCRGAFRCTPCLDGMEADAADAAAGAANTKPAQRMVLYVAHPSAPTDAEIRAIGVPSAAATEFSLRGLAVRENIERAMRWLAWLRRAFQETTFIAPWIANILAHGDEVYITAFERGGNDACVVERCDGIVLCGARISDGMRREAERGFARDLELPPFRAWDLTCATEPEPPTFQPGRSFHSWATVYKRTERDASERRGPDAV